MKGRSQNRLHRHPYACNKMTNLYLGTISGRILTQCCDLQKQMITCKVLLNKWNIAKTSKEMADRALFIFDMLI
jgi:hypothetical protein